MSLYRCDPKKHRNCTRGRDICQRWCVLTTVQEFSTDGRALSEEEVERLEDEIRAQQAPGIKIGGRRK